MDTTIQSCRNVNKLIFRKGLQRKVARIRANYYAHQNTSVLGVEK